MISRYNDFPIRLNSARIILLHWVIVTLMAPLGFYFRIFSVLTVAAYAVFLFIMLFTRSKDAGISPAIAPGPALSEEGAAHKNKGRRNDPAASLCRDCRSALYAVAGFFVFLITIKATTATTMSISQSHQSLTSQ